MCCRQIIDFYTGPNMTVDQIRSALQRERFDPNKDFSAVARKELQEIAADG
jgi:hypothetical protein